MPTGIQVLQGASHHDAGTSPLDLASTSIKLTCTLEVAIAIYSPANKRLTSTELWKEWAGWRLPGSRGSVVSAQTLTLSSILVEVSLSCSVSSSLSQRFKLHCIHYQATKYTLLTIVYILLCMRDCPATNNVALQTLKVLYPKNS